MLMKVIKDVIKHMDDSLDEAHCYYKEYVIYKEEFPKFASLSLELAKEHLDIYMKLHNIVVLTINEYKYKSKTEIPAEMKAVWNYEHEKLTEEYDKLKYDINNAM